MALDQKLKTQLLEARKNICTQLEQLERQGLGNPYMEPDCRDVYASLQRELHEIDELLEADGDKDVEAKSSYQSMVRWYADGTVGNPVRPTTIGIILGIIGVAVLVLQFGVALFRAATN
jgi:hypothetical protein